MRYKKLNSTPRESATGLQRGLTGDFDEVARQRPLRMLCKVLEVEVEEFLGRRRYERSSTASARDSEEFRGCRNGYGKKRRVMVVSGTLSIRAPGCVRHLSGLNLKCFVPTSGDRIGSES